MEAAGLLLPWNYLSSFLEKEFRLEFLDQRTSYLKDYLEEQEEVGWVSSLELMSSSGLTEEFVEKEVCAVCDHSLLDWLCCSCSSVAVADDSACCCWSNHTDLVAENVSAVAAAVDSSSKDELHTGFPCIG